MSFQEAALNPQNHLKLSLHQSITGKTQTGINPDNFYFSWKMNSDKQNVKQTAYQILVSGDKDFSEKSILWDSGKTTSDQSILVQYQGQKPDFGTTYFWKVKAWDNYGNESDWSEINRFTTGLFSDSDWDGAKWIALDKLDSANRIVPGIHLPGKSWSGKDLGFHKLPILRKEFEVKGRLKQALVFVSGLGQYEMQLNGKKVGDHFLAPGWTDYDETALYNTYDITSLLNTGENAMGFYLGNGFFIVPNSRYRKVMTAYGNPMMILKIEIDLRRWKYRRYNFRSVVENNSRPNYLFKYLWRRNLECNAGTARLGFSGI